MPDLNIAVSRFEGGLLHTFYFTASGPIESEALLAAADVFDSAAELVAAEEDEEAEAASRD